MNEDVFLKEMKKIGYELNEVQLLLFNNYFHLLIEYNQHTNLTTIIQKEDVYLKHFYDSAALIRKTDFNQINNFVDVGTGAGFPGVVIKILYPHLSLILIDSNNKKTSFLEHLCHQLLLENVEIKCARSEDFARDNIDKYDCVVARAVKQLDVLSEICIPLVKIGGFFIAMKANIDEEINNSKDIIAKLGGEIITIDNFSLPIEGSVRNNIKIKKTRVTPLGYPREYSTIIKKALKKNQI